jgi:uncharacterized protein (TIGR02145 family)
MRGKPLVYLSSLAAALLSVAILGCGEDDKSNNPPAKTVPVVTTAAVGSITETTAECGGTVTSDGGATVTARGVCWSTNATPTVTDSKTVDGADTGSFVSSITSLTEGTSYNVRAYATNSVGTGYGAIRPFQTDSSSGESTGTVMDIDGNVYKTIKIGNQWWMAENLKVTHYRNGSPIQAAAYDPNGDLIPNVSDNAAWSVLTTGAYCDYDNNSANGDIYGHLYNYYALVDSREIAPIGWHVPTDGEWQTLINFLGGDAAAGGGLKEVGTAHWIDPNTGATDQVGFTALPAGYRLIQGEFRRLGESTLIWSSTEDDSQFAWYRGLFNSTTQVNHLCDSKKIGMSVRCVRD